MAIDSGLEFNLWKKEDHSRDSHKNVLISIQKKIRNNDLHLEKFVTGKKFADTCFGSRN